MRRIPEGAAILTADAMRAAEAAAFAAGTSQAELMERAGVAVAAQVARLASGRPVLVLAGPGNNGGDGYVAARVLKRWGHDVALATFGHPASTVAKDMAAAWDGPTCDVHAASPRPVLVDALFGIGLSRPLDVAVTERMRVLGEAAELRIAVDLPTGLATDSGEDLGAGVPNDVTVALGALKPAHVAGDMAHHCGHVLLADIGLAAASSWRTLAQPPRRAPDASSHKYSRGMVVVLGGAMPGAAHLAARAALHGGAGYVVLAGRTGASGPPESIVRRTIAADGLPELLEDERVSTVLVGPGLGRDDDAHAILDAAVRCDRSLVIDGDALTLLGRGATDRIARRSAPTCLTPHGGEFGRMFAGAETGKIQRTTEAARACRATIVHKGADTVVAQPDGGVEVSVRGTSWLSTAGSGDVLAGLIASRWAGNHADRGLIGEAVWLHGRSAELAGPAFAADDLIAHLPAALAECR